MDLKQGAKSYDAGYKFYKWKWITWGWIWMVGLVCVCVCTSKDVNKEKEDPWDTSGLLRVISSQYCCTWITLTNGYVSVCICVYMDVSAWMYCMCGGSGNTKKRTFMKCTDFRHSYMSAPLTYELASLSTQPTVNHKVTCDWQKSLVGLGLWHKVCI